MVDGQALPCSSAMRVLGFGNSRNFGGSDGTSAAATLISQVWVDEWEDVETPPGAGTQNPNDGSWTGVVTTQIRNVGRFVTIQDRGPVPQWEIKRLTREDVSALVDRVYQMFKDHPGCEESTNKMLNELKNSTGVDAGSIRDILEDFRKHGNIDVYKHDVSGGAAGDGMFNVSSKVIDSNEIATIMGEMIHSAGWYSQYGGPDGGRESRASFYTDTAMANAYHKLGVVMSIDQYKKTYPDAVKKTIEQYKYDYTANKLAHAGIEMTCLGIKTGVTPQDAKPSTKSR